MLKKLHQYVRRKNMHDKAHIVMIIRLLLIILVLSIIYLIFVPGKVGMKGLQKDFSGKIIMNGEEIPFDQPFRLKTTHLCNAVLDSKIGRIDTDTVTMVFLSHMEATRQFTRFVPPVEHVIGNGDCVPGYPLCEDTAFQYCFSIKNNSSESIIDYEVVEKS